MPIGKLEEVLGADRYAREMAHEHLATA